MDPLRSATNRGLTAIDGAMALIAILLRADVAAFGDAGRLSGGHIDAALPAAIASGVLFAVCAGLYGFVRKLDREARWKP